MKKRTDEYRMAKKKIFRFPVGWQETSKSLKLKKKKKIFFEKEKKKGKGR